MWLKLDVDDHTKSGQLRRWEKTDQYWTDDDDDDNRWYWTDDDDGSFSK